MDSLLDFVQVRLSDAAASQQLFIFFVAAGVFMLSLAVCGLLFALANPLRRRVQQLHDAPAGGPSRLAGIAQVIRPFSAYMLPRAERERSRVEQLLLCAGIRSPNALVLFYTTKSVLMLSLPILVFLASPLVPKLSTGMVWFIAIGTAFLGSILPSLWLDRRVKSRQRLLRIGFPDALDLLVVCVESGLGLAPALQRVAEELAVSSPELGEELTIVNAEIRAGVERAQALKNLATRTGLEDIRGLAALLVQTMRFGTSIADALRVYSEEFRDKRMQAAEEQAAKIGTKMIFPLVFCLFPSFFLVAIGPAVIRLVEVFKHIAH